MPGIEGSRPKEPKFSHPLPEGTDGVRSKSEEKWTKEVHFLFKKLGYALSADKMADHSALGVLLLKEVCYLRELGTLPTQDTVKTIDNLYRKLLSRDTTGDKGDTLNSIHQLIPTLRNDIEKNPESLLREVSSLSKRDMIPDAETVGTFERIYEKLLRKDTTGDKDGTFARIAQHLSTLRVGVEKELWVDLQPPEIGNPGNNCYMNSSLQMILREGPFRGHLDEVEEAQGDYAHEAQRTKAQVVLNRLKEVAHAWDEKKGAELLQNHVNALRRSIYGLCVDSGSYKGINNDFFYNKSETSQCDASELIRLLAKIVGHSWSMDFKKEKIGSPDSTSREPSRIDQVALLGPVPLNKKVEEGHIMIDLEASINGALRVDVESDAGKKFIDTTHFHGEAPDTVMVELGRFAGLEKDRDPLMLPENDRVVVDGQAYEVVGYIKHNGLTRHSGHYITERKIDDFWFRCSDDSISLIPSLDQREPADATVVFLKKLGASPPPSA